MDLLTNRQLHKVVMGYEDRNRYKIINKCDLLHLELHSEKHGLKARL